jgi:hypothetical protein
MLPSPYGPDRSLRLAAVVLLGGGLLSTGLIYLLVTIGPMIPSPANTPEAQIAHSSRNSISALQRERDRPRTRPSHRRQPAPSNRRFRRSRTHHSPLSTPYHLFPDHPSTTSPLDTYSPHSIESPEIAGLSPEPLPRPSAAPVIGRSTPPQNRPEWTTRLPHLNGQLRALSGALTPPHRSSNKRRARADNTTSLTPGANSASPGVPTPPPQVPADGGFGWLAATGKTHAALRLQTQAASNKGTNTRP